MDAMYDEQIRRAALERLATKSLSEVSRATGISRAPLRDWRDRTPRPRQGGCPRCCDDDLDGVAYALLLGLYLGDGCVCANARYYSLRVSCDATCPGIIREWWG